MHRAFDNPVAKTIIAFFLLHTAAFCETIRFPGDAGVINVKEPPYNAKGDGVADDTKALNRAFRTKSIQPPWAAPIIYIPEGIYLCSDTVWIGMDGTGNGSREVWGESREKTIIKLKDRCPRYGDKNRPRVFVATKKPSMPYGAWGQRGNNMNFRTYVRNVTINTGKGNPGTVALEFQSHNMGGVQDVTIISEDRQGFSGLDMRAPWNGPALCMNVEIIGFDYGLYNERSTIMSTFYDITIREQNIAGWMNAGHPVAIRKFFSFNSVPAIINKNASAHFVVIDAKLEGGAASRCAIENSSKAVLFARNLRVKGYGASLRNDGTTLERGDIPEIVIGETAGACKTRRSLNLPLIDPPVVTRDPPQNWVNVQSYKNLVKNGDWGPAIQAAIDKNATTIYFPKATYDITSTVVVRGALRRIEGLMSSLRPDKAAFGKKPVIRIASTDAKAVHIERLMFDGQSHLDPETMPFCFEYASSKSCIIRNCNGRIRNAAGAGSLYVFDICYLSHRFDYPGRVYFFQCDQEGVVNTRIYNNAADLFILGLKSEGAATEVFTGRSARTEVMGGLIYPGYSGDYTLPAFVNDGGALSVSTALFWAQKELVRETIRGRTVSSYQKERGHPHIALYTSCPGGMPVATATEGLSCKNSVRGFTARGCTQFRARHVCIFDPSGRIIARHGAGGGNFARMVLHRNLPLCTAYIVHSSRPGAKSIVIPKMTR